MLAQVMPQVPPVHLRSIYICTFKVYVHSLLGAVDGDNIQKDSRLAGIAAGLKHVAAHREQIAGIGTLWYLRPVRGVAQPG